MRLRFFLWASADLGVRRSKVASSFCRSGYIELLRVTQAADSRAIRLPGGGKPPGVDLSALLEEKLQSQLQQARIADLINLSELWAVREIAVRVEKLCMVKNVEELGSEINTLDLRYFEGLKDGEVRLADVRTAADRAG